MSSLSQDGDDPTLELDLSKRHLRTLPPEVAGMKNLRILTLVDNHLTTLPEWIGDLTNLRNLNLGFNHLTALPESLRHLSGLQYLNLNESKLTVLSEWIGVMTDLRELVVSYNKLTSLPGSIGNLGNLHSLDLFGNQLETLPDSVGKLANLRSLDLRSNRLTVVPESICDLNRLRELDLSHNNLTTLPEAIAKLSILQVLNLEGNPLASGLARVYLGGEIQELAARLSERGWVKPRIKEVMTLFSRSGRGERLIRKLVRHFDKTGFVSDALSGVCDDFLANLAESDIECLLPPIEDEMRSAIVTRNKGVYCGFCHLFLDLVRGSQFDRVKERIHSTILRVSEDAIEEDHRFGDTFIFHVTLFPVPKAGTLAIDILARYLGLNYTYNDVHVLPYLARMGTDEATKLVIGTLETYRAKDYVVKDLYEAGNPLAIEYLLNLVKTDNYVYGAEALKAFARGGRQEVLPVLMALCQGSGAGQNRISYPEMLSLIKRFGANHYNRAANYVIQHCFAYGCPVHTSCRGKLLPKNNFAFWQCSEDGERYALEFDPFALRQLGGGKGLYRFPGQCFSCGHLAYYDDEDWAVVCRHCGDMRSLDSQ